MKRQIRSYVRAVLAFSLVGAVVALPILGIEVPGELTGMAAAAVGFYYATEENGNRREHIENMNGV